MLDTAADSTADRAATCVLSCRDLCKSYRMAEVEVRALDHVDFALQRGELLVLVGASGSGLTARENVELVRNSFLRRLLAGLVALLGAATPLAVGCLAPTTERLTCDDTLSSDQFKTSDLETLIAGTSGKGCAAEGCHDGKTREQGFRLDSSVYVYEELSTRGDILYAMIASGEMPTGNGTRWDENDLRLFRSWYCNGGFPQ